MCRNWGKSVRWGAPLWYKRNVRHDEDNNYYVVAPKNPRFDVRYAFSAGCRKLKITSLLRVLAVRRSNTSSKREQGLEVFIYIVRRTPTISTSKGKGKGKGKSIPLQAWTGPEGSRKLSFPDFVTTAQDGGKVVSLTHRPLFTPRKYFWYSFLLEAESTPGP